MTAYESLKRSWQAYCIDGSRLGGTGGICCGACPCLSLHRVPVCTCQVVAAIGPAGAESLLVKLSRWSSSPEHSSAVMCGATALGCCNARSLQSIDSTVEPFVWLLVSSWMFLVVPDMFVYSRLVAAGSWIPHLLHGIGQDLEMF